MVRKHKCFPGTRVTHENGVRAEDDSLTGGVQRIGTPQIATNFELLDQNIH